jgi:hypothetical protein
VNALFSWPKSSEEISVEATSAQFITKAAARREQPLFNARNPGLPEILSLQFLFQALF